MAALRQASATAASFTLGYTLGRLGLLDPALVEGLVWPLLAVLVVLVGAMVGASRDKLEGGLSRAWLGVAMALAALAASSLAGLLVAPLAGIPPKASAAAAAGMGWYTYTGPYLAATLDPQAGLVGFSANLARELATLVAYPLLPGRLRVPGVAIGGATTMDTSLPVIAKHGGPEAALVAVSYGLASTLLVPVALPLIAG